MVLSISAVFVSVLVKRPRYLEVEAEVAGSSLAVSWPRSGRPFGGLSACGSSADMMGACWHVGQENRGGWEFKKASMAVLRASFAYTLYSVPT